MPRPLAQGGSGTTAPMNRLAIARAPEDNDGIVRTTRKIAADGPPVVQTYKRPDARPPAARFGSARPPQAGSSGGSFGARGRGGYRGQNAGRPPWAGRGDGFGQGSSAGPSRRQEDFRPGPSYGPGSYRPPPHHELPNRPSAYGLSDIDDGSKTSRGSREMRNGERDYLNGQGSYGPAVSRGTWEDHSRGRSESWSNGHGDGERRPPNPQHDSVPQSSIRSGRPSGWDNNGSSHGNGNPKNGYTNRPISPPPSFGSANSAGPSRIKRTHSPTPGVRKGPAVKSIHSHFAEDEEESFNSTHTRSPTPVSQRPTRRSPSPRGARDAPMIVPDSSSADATPEPGPVERLKFKPNKPKRVKDDIVPLPKHFSPEKDKASTSSSKSSKRKHRFPSPSRPATTSEPRPAKRKPALPPPIDLTDMIDEKPDISLLEACTEEEALNQPLPDSERDSGVWAVGRHDPTMPPACYAKDQNTKFKARNAFKAEQRKRMVDEGKEPGQMFWRDDGFALTWTRKVKEVPTVPAAVTAAPAGQTEPILAMPGKKKKKQRQAEREKEEARWRQEQEQQQQEEEFQRQHAKIATSTPALQSAIAPSAPKQIAPPAKVDSPSKPSPSALPAPEAPIPTASAAPAATSQETKIPTPAPECPVKSQKLLDLEVSLEKEMKSIDRWTEMLEQMPNLQKECDRQVQRIQKTIFDLMGQIEAEKGKMKVEP